MANDARYEISVRPDVTTAYTIVTVRISDEAIRRLGRPELEPLAEAVKNDLQRGLLRAWERDHGETEL